MSLLRCNPGDRDDLEASPYDILLGQIDSVIAEWRSLIRPSAGAALPPARLLDSLPEILPRLIRLARLGAPQLDDDVRRCIASEHGESRRADDMPIDWVAEEWSALKRACWQVLARHGFVNDTARPAMERLDILIDDAVGYTLRGYYRPELDTLKGRGLERREEQHDRRTRTEDRRSEGDPA
ncbi:MAG TPA: hypothetical protein VFW98_18485 [Gemmatimonadaceae bacterium]|nr:hypothetical protein [Gemmatimonadaceae bacterium]